MTTYHGNSYLFGYRFPDIPKSFYLLAFLVGLYVIYSFAIIVYELYFSPLSKLPGRKLWIAFPLLRYVAAMRGTMDIEVRALHEKYGDVVRISPTEVTFATPEAWQDIYGHGHQLPKVVRWEKDSTPNVLFTDDNVLHTKYRKALSHGFSDKALRLQEPLIRAYIDLLVEKLNDVAASRTKTDMAHWYNLTTFDVISDLSFGQSCRGLRTTKMHHWVANIFQFAKRGMLVRLANAYPLIGSLIRLFVPKSVIEVRQKQQILARNAITNRLNGKHNDRSDFLDSMLRHKSDKDELSLDELVSNASILILAGSETTATLLSGVTYWLLATPHALKKVTDEVRMTFEKEEDISFISTANKLPYMVACLDEALRIYPPAPTHFMRYTRLGAPTVISGVEIPPNTHVGVNQLSANWSCRKFP